MEIDELASSVGRVPPDSDDPAIDWDERGRLWRELEGKAETLVTSVVPEGFCTAQEWDNRLDCGVTLQDGQVVGEMIVVGQLTTWRLAETAERLRLRRVRELVQLVDEIRPPLLIG